MQGGPDVFNPAPADLGDRQESFNSADVNKGAKIKYPGNRAGHDLAQFKGVPQFLLLLACFFLQHGPAGHQNIAALLAKLRNPEGMMGADKAFVGLLPAQAGLGKWTKGALVAGNLDLVTALDLLLHKPLHRNAGPEGLFEVGTGRRSAHAGGEQHLVAVG